MSWIELAAHAEPAAHVDLGQPQRADGDVEDLREDRTVDVDALRRADQVDLAAARVGRDRHEAARLQRRRGLPGIVEGLAHHHVRGRERGIRVTDAHGDRGHVVRVGAAVEARRARRQRGRGRRARGQRLVDDVDALERVAGDVRVVADHERDGLADVADDVARDRRLQIAVRARRRGDAVRDDRVRRHVRRREDRVHAGKVERALDIDRDQPRVRVRRPQDDGVEHAGHADVVGELPAPLDVPLAADPGMRLADHGR